MNFLQVYHVTSAIPKYLVIKARNAEPLENELYTRNNFLFQLDNSTQLHVQLECLYRGEKDSIDHTFLNCRLLKFFVNNIIDWFNVANNSKFAPTIEEKLFGIKSGPYEKGILKKFNYAILFTNIHQMHNQAIHLFVFVNKLLSKNRIESFSQFIVARKCSSQKCNGSQEII